MINILKEIGIILKTEGKESNHLFVHVHKYEAVRGSFVDIGIVVAFLSFT